MARKKKAVQRNFKKQERGFISDFIFLGLGIISIIAGWGFFSNNITGFAVANLTSADNNVIGACLVILGLVVIHAFMNRSK